MVRRRVLDPVFGGSNPPTPEGRHMKIGHVVASGSTTENYCPSFKGNPFEVALVIYDGVLSKFTMVSCGDEAVRCAMEILGVSPKDFTEIYGSSEVERRGLPLRAHLEAMASLLPGDLLERIKIQDTTFNISIKLNREKARYYKDIGDPDDSEHGIDSIW
jgi:hypothetical protein